MKKIILLSLLLLSMLTYSQARIFYEDFSASTIPAGWSIINMSGGNGSHTWTFGSGQMPTGQDFSTNAAIFNDPNGVHDYQMLYYSQGLDLSQHENITLSFTYAIQAYTQGGTDYGRLIFFIYDNTSHGYLFAHIFDSDQDPTTFSFDVDAFLANHSSVDSTNFIFGFAWDDENHTPTWGAGINNVRIIGTPVNDACSDAIAFNALPYENTQLLNGTTNNGGFITISGCGSGMNDGVWYKFTPAHSGLVTVTETANDFDSELGIYTGTCGNLTCVDVKDNTLSGGAETSDFEVTAGEDYLINIGYFSYQNDYEEKGNMTLQVAYKILNDEAADAISIPVGDYQSACTSPTVVHLTGAETSSASINGTPFFSSPDAGYNGGDVWYKFVAPNSGAVELTVPQLSDWSSMMHAIYSSTTDTTPSFIPEEHGNYTINNSSHIPSVTHYRGLHPGSTYFLRVWEYDNNNLGDVSFCLKAFTGNDEATNAYNIPVAAENANIIPYRYANNEGATDSSPINGNITTSNFNGGDIWFKFTAPSTGSVNVVVPVVGEWSSFIHYLYDSETSQSPIDHKSNMNINLSSQIPSTVNYDNLTPGQVYYMRAFDYGNDNFGTVKFYIQAAQSQSVEDYTALNFTYYPNPAKDVIYLRSHEKISQVSLSNFLGQEVKHIAPQKNQVKLNLNDLKNGVYFMKVTTGDNSQIVKIIKN